MKSDIKYNVKIKNNILILKIYKSQHSFKELIRIFSIKEFGLNISQ
jgi:hypothetical protein